MVALIILGCGYVGARLARAALADGRTVRVCARGTGRLTPLGELGAQVKYLDAGVPKQFGPVMSSLHGATVVYSIPPVPTLLLAGSHDLSTPLEWARAEASLTPRGRLVVVQNAGHSVQVRATNDAGRRAVAKFLTAPSSA